MISVVVGNPKPRSRTRDAAVQLAEAVMGSAPDVIVDVADLGSGLLGWGNPAVAEAVEATCSSTVCVVASPTFKATYTGLLKLFLDQIPTGGLDGVTALPLMLGAGHGHAMAPDLLLKPVLVELGATCPVPGPYLLDSDYGPGQARDAWVKKAQRFFA
ncbi:NADPH-dependent FMN reductase [Rhodococcus sp. NPDC057529]|uniref:NADPH-dependent FMN reductase n=1 Tax=Rhodococcus sp. NPDC057529 TaxID=3346158 RepID=UPI00367188D0